MKKQFLCVCALLLGCARPVLAAPISFDQQVTQLEQQAGGRLGVMLLDTENGRQWGHRADERFAMCSTFKVLLAAKVLSDVDAGRFRLDKRIAYGARDVLDYAPVTRLHVGVGMTVAELAAAAVEQSDSTAANLLLQQIGGPSQVTQFVRGLGDAVTRLDRDEPALNSNLPHDVRDTSSPAAMATTLHVLLTGKGLAPIAQARLLDWMVNSSTGATRIRAGVPAGWRVGDKTGTSDNGAANDVAILWPPHHAPVLLVVYYDHADSTPPARDAVIAQTARLAASALMEETQRAW